MSGRKKTRFPGVFRNISRRGKKYDTFTARVYDPFVKSKQRWVGTYKTAEEARDAKIKAEKAMRRREAGRFTVADFAGDWLNIMPRYAPTAREYGYAIKGFVAEFGDEFLDELNRPLVRTWAMNAPYQQFQVARTMLGDATNLGYIDASPLANLRRPKPEGRRHLVPPTLDEMREMAAMSQDVLGDTPFGRRFGALLLFASGTLMRPAEIAGLNFEDLDWENELIHIRRQRPAKGQERKPKSKVMRTAAFTPLAQEAIKSLPKPWRGRVFPNTRGESATTNVYGNHFVKVRAAWLAKHGYTQEDKKLTLYLATRHAGASYLRNELDVPVDDIRVQLGQADTSLVDLYSHPNDDAAFRRIRDSWRKKSGADHQDEPRRPKKTVRSRRRKSKDASPKGRRHRGDPGC